MTTPVAWLGTEAVSVQAATVPVTAGGYRLGDGVFSTLRVSGGIPLDVDRHATRVCDDAAIIGLSPPGTGVVAAAARTIARTNAALLGDHVLRVQLARGAGDARARFGTPADDDAVLVITSSPAPSPRPAPALASVAGARRPAAVKSTSWAWSAWAGAMARGAGADLAVLHEDGEVLEAQAGNLVVVVDGAAVTPLADGRVLPGTTRAALLEADVGVIEASVTRAALERAEEVLVLSAVRGVEPARSVDGRTLPFLGGEWHDRLTTALRAQGWPEGWPGGPPR